MDEVDRRKIGERCRACRKKKRWTQAELAERIGLSVNQISNIENGKTTIPTDTLLKLADAFEVSIDYLLCRDEKIIEEDSDESAVIIMIKLIIDNLRKLELKDLKMILDMSERLKR